MAEKNCLGTPGRVGTGVLPGLPAAFGDAAVEDRRNHPRRQPHRPTRVMLHDGAEPRTAFTRDVSPGGIGLMHPFPLEPGENVLELPAGENPPLCVRVEITWCLPCRDGWYQSGARLLGPADASTGGPPN